MSSDDDQWEAIHAAVTKCSTSIASAPETFDAMTSTAFSRLRRSQKDEMASAQFRELVRSQLRTATLVEERRAQAAQAQARRAETKAKPKMDVMSGVKHGSYAKRNGGGYLGCMCPQCVRCREIEDEGARRLYSRVGAIVDEYVQEMRLEWTAELLASTFALADGSLVRWGEATVDHHEQRLEMFKMNAHANLEGAARHQQALTDLAAFGAGCLDELVVKVAA